MTPTRLWRIAGALLITYIVMAFAGFALQRSVVLGDSPENGRAALVDSSMAQTFTGGYVEYLGVLVFLVAAALLARLLRGAGPLADWLSSCITAAAVTFVSVTLATGLAAGAAALYHGHHSGSLQLITTVNDIRNFAFFLSIGVEGVLALAVAGAIVVTRALPRWLAWAGFAVGTLCIVGVAGAAWGVHDYVGMLWFVWLLALGVAALRGPRQPTADVPDRLAVRA